MTSFSADWLALREPADAAARSTAVAAAAAAALAGRPSALVVDLGAGTGANRRYLSERLPDRPRWRLVDRDDALLAVAATARRDHPSALEIVRADLTPFDGARLLAGADLVTASALLDLVSEPWLDALAESCVARRAVVLFALSYDGRIVCDPPDPLDAEMLALVNAHQRTDKGFGPALGPAAAGAVRSRFAADGYEIVSGRADWRLGPEEAALQRALIDGWAAAARAIQPDRAAAIEGWRERRAGRVAAGVSRMLVGHEDMAGWPRRT